MSEKLSGLSVSAVIRVQSKPGRKQEALDWFTTLTNKAAAFSGYQSTDIFEELHQHAKPQLAIIIHFDTYENAMQWENSAEKIKEIDRSSVLFDVVKPIITIAGLEYRLASTPVKATAPPKWKMMIITVVVLYTLFNTLLPLLQQLFNRFHVPVALHTILSLVIMVSLMSYLIMPAVTKVLAPWLFNKTS